MTLNKTSRYLLVVLAFIVSACSAPATEAPAAAVVPATEAPAATAAPLEPATLKLTLGQGGTGAVEFAVSKFKEKFPGSDVVIEEVPFNDLNQTLIMQYGQGQNPDVSVMFSLKSFAAQGLLEDLSGKMSESHSFKNLTLGQLERIEYDGKNWAITHGNNFPVLFYNIDLLKKAGVVNYPPKTWAELEDACKKIQEANIEIGGKKVVPYVFPSYRWFISPFIWQAGGQEINDDKTEVLLDSPEAIEGLEFAQGLIKKGYSIKPEGEAAQEVAGSFISGWSAFYVGGVWTTAGIIEAGINFDVTTLPGKTEDLAATSIGGAEFVIYNNSKHKELSWEFLKILDSEESQLSNVKKGGINPTATYLFEEPHLSAISAVIPQYKYQVSGDLKSFPISHYSYIEGPFWYLEGGNSWQATIESILIDLVDVKPAMTALDAELQEKLDEYWKK